MSMKEMMADKPEAQKIIGLRPHVVHRRGQRAGREHPVRVGGGGG